MRSIYSCIFLWVVGAGPLLQAQSYEDLKAEIQKILYLDAAVDFVQTPGLIIGGWHEGQQFQYSFGYTDTEQSDTLKGESLFCIGEVSQLFTALLAHQLERAGQIGLKDSLVQVSIKKSSLNQLIISDLINHKAALPTLPNNQADGPEAYTSKDLEQWFQSGDCASDPDLDYRFSNLHYALLQYELEARTDNPLQQLFEQHLFTEIKLPDTRVFSGAEALSQGYSQAGIVVDPKPFQAYQGAKGMISTMDDLLQFSRWLLDNYGNAAWSPYWAKNQLKAGPQIKKRLYAGQGWHIFDIRKFPAIWLHTGTANGHRAFIGIVPETQTAVVVLSNSPHGLNGFGFLVLRMLNNNWKLKAKGLKHSSKSSH
ncbi:MAG: beta-lactamase family protein [Phaeodactylibacter sp.]|nr:beta-lactamase family protein [Phaeodactylibacter sp.]